MIKEVVSARAIVNKDQYGHAYASKGVQGFQTLLGIIAIFQELLFLSLNLTKYSRMSFFTKYDKVVKYFSLTNLTEFEACSNLLSFSCKVCQATQLLSYEHYCRY